MMKADLFYADGGMVANKYPGWLQSAFDTLMGLFDRVGLWKNARKTVGMACRPCQESEVWADEAYTRRMKGEGRGFKERQQERVICPECGKELAKGSLVAHRQTQHGMEKRGLGQEGDEEAGGDKPRTYMMDFPAKAGPNPCPVEGCSGRASTGTEMRMHFCYRHVRDTVVILKEGNLPHPRCPLRDMPVPWKSLNGMHRRTLQRKRGAERKQRRLAAEEDREVTKKAFSAYGHPLDMVTSL